MRARPRARAIVSVLFVYGWCAASQGYDYCSISCNGVQHTMCKYPEGEDQLCGRSGLTKGEKLLILQMHNQFRQKVATGQETRGPQPPAADMRQLSWDRETARVAQRWASQCREQEDGHDRCRLSRDGTPVGQNIARYSVSGGVAGRHDRNDTIAGMLQDLYDEVRDFAPSRVGSLRLGGDGPEVGHYTQLVWANTSHVGCGLLESRGADRSRRASAYHYKLVCNYKPAGNVISYPVYRVGSPCSACPGSPRPRRCSPQYTGLCLP